MCKRWTKAVLPLFSESPDDFSDWRVSRIGMADDETERAMQVVAAARTKRVSFHHRFCDTRIREQLNCPTSERTVERSEIVSGYEIER